MKREPPASFRSVVLLAIMGLIVGWEGFRFICDDAFIDFRYAAHARAGLGLVWNPEPFQPVEGYTSFSWVALLWGVWQATGLDPVRSVGWLGLGCSIGSVLVIARWGRSLMLSPFWMMAVFIGILTNRTFLVWSSGGLETPLWTVALLAWAESLWNQRRTVGLWALLLALTRPDGLLFVALTPLAYLRRPAQLLTLWPLLGVGLHLIWRHETYGQWLPNTAYAKIAQAWPEAGLRYLLSFVLEYGLYLTPVLVALSRPAVRWEPARAVVVLSFGLHLLWYGLWVGGDHFEYRIFMHLVPLLWLGLCAALSEQRWGPAAWLLQLLVTLPIPWAYTYAASQPRDRANLHGTVIPVSPHVPAVFGIVAQPWDALQAWLIPHYVGIRWEEHRDVALGYQTLFGPRRSDTPGLDPNDIPVYSGVSIGVVGWTLTNAAILDPCGLVDAVVARNPELRPEARMAHQRQPPAGYIDCFGVDISLFQDRVVRSRRATPLTADTVRACEATYWEQAGLDRVH